MATDTEPHAAVAVELPGIIKFAYTNYTVNSNEAKCKATCKEKNCGTVLVEKIGITSAFTK